PAPEYWSENPATATASCVAPLWLASLFEVSAPSSEDWKSRLNISTTSCRTTHRRVTEKGIGPMPLHGSANPKPATPACPCAGSAACHPIPQNFRGITLLVRSRRRFSQDIPDRDGGGAYPERSAP